MNIGIDARGLDGNKSGIPIYIQEIVKKINDLPNKDNKYILYSSREIKLDFKVNDNIIIKEDKKPLGSFWLYFKLPKILKEDKIDVFWGTQHCLPKRNKYTKDIKFVLTIHDLAIKKLKTVGSWKNTIIQKIFVKRSLKAADKIIAISEATKKDIIKLYKINEEKVTVVYNGTNLVEEYNLKKGQEEKIQEKFKIKDSPYIFFVSTIEPRKNIETLIRAFEYIRRKENINLKLVLAGGLGWKYENILNIIQNSEYKSDIIMPGYISKEEKECLYKHATCFAYPSLYEGFGLPVLEAMARKTIVVTSNVSSLPEVGGRAVYYYEGVLNYGELGNKILEVIHLSSEEKERKINLGLEQVKKFTWEKCAKETLGIIER